MKDAKKANELTRRRFIQQVGLFLGAFSVPWGIRLETMSKISKRLFGSSTAFAAPGDVGRIVIDSFWRSGYPFLSGPFCMQRDFETATENRSFFENPNGTQTDFVDQDSTPATPGEAQRYMTASGNYLYFPSVMAPLVQAHGNRIVTISSVRNTTGHTNIGQTTKSGMSAHRLVAAAWKNDQGLAPTIMTGPIAYAQENRASFSATGPLGATYAPTYVSGPDEVSNSFDQFRLNPPNRSEPMNEEITQQILAFIKQHDAGVLEKIQVDNRPGGLAAQAAEENAHVLLAQNLRALVEPDPDLVTILQTGVDTGTLNTRGDLAEIFAQIIQMAENGVASAFGFQVLAGDSHGRYQNQGSNAGTFFDDAQALNQLLLNFLNELAARPDPTGNYASLLDRTTMTFDTEFGRGYGGPSDFSDGNTAAAICITDPSMFNQAGTHGNYNENLGKIAPSTHGNAAPSQVEPNQVSDALLSMSGLTDAEMVQAGFAEVNQNDRLICRKQSV